MKIGFVFDDSLDKTDGVQQYVLALGQWMVEGGHEVHYLVGETIRQDLPNLHSLSRNVNVRFNGNRMSVPLPAPRKAIAELLAREKFDVLHVQMPYSPFMAHRVIQAASPDTAVVGTFHVAPASPAMTIGTKLLGYALRPTIKRFDTFLSVSTAAHDFAKRTFGIASQVLPNVVDYQRFHSAEPFKRSKGALNILFLGRLVPRKGCHVLLEAVNRLTEESLPPFRVQVCGRGPLEASLRQYVASNNLQTRVEFTGYVPEDEKPRYYASSDIAVFPSSGGESFGIVLIEAMASGRTAVLAGNNSGYAAVMSEKPELLFAPKNSQELAAKLGHLLAEADYRREVAEWGAEYTRQFDTAVVGGKLLELYKQALRLRRDMR